MKVLLIGGTGMLGSELLTQAPKNCDIVAPTHALLDVTDHAALSYAIDELRPDWVVNASAFTAVDDAESSSDQAFAVNADSVGALGRACASRGIRVLHFSTDYVFDGTSNRPYREEDDTNPINVYGRSKLAGEQALHSAGALALIVRTQWLFGRRGRSFPLTMLDRATQRQPTRVVGDQFGRPTYTVDLAQAAWQLIALGASGVYHAANRGSASWYDVASFIFDFVGVAHLLSRCTTADFPTAARRPAFSVLDTSKLEHTTGASLPEWRHALARFLHRSHAPEHGDSLVT